MSVYSTKGKGWRYDFTMEGRRYTGAGFKTKTAARQAEAERRKEERGERRIEETPTDMAFLDLVNRRLDHLQAYKSERYYTDYRWASKKWVRNWGRRMVGTISREEIESFLLKRSKVSNITANKELIYLRALFNFGRKRGWIDSNPTEGIPYLPVERKVRYVPSVEDIEKVIAAAENPDDRDYLIAIRETMGRMSEINRLTWEDVDLEGRFIVLYTRKKRGGNLTPRKIPMTRLLYEVMSRRAAEREPDKPWVFWHRYRCRKTGERRVGPYKNRKRLMRTLCEKAEVRYFRFHALRHAGASLMDNLNIPIGSIQRILGHEKRTTTEIYLHSIGQAEREAMDLFERVRRNSHTKVSHQRGEEDRDGS